MGEITTNENKGDNENFASMKHEKRTHNIPPNGFQCKQTNKYKQSVEETMHV